MQTDLDRLERMAANLARIYGPRDTGPVLIREAAAEITSLRARVRELEATIERMCGMAADALRYLEGSGVTMGGPPSGVIACCQILGRMLCARPPTPGEGEAGRS